MTEKGFRRLVVSSALYDLVATAGFMTPWSFALVHALLSRLSPLPDFEPLHVLFANLLGSVVVVWSVLRLRKNDRDFGLYDACARLLFFAWQLYYLLEEDGSPLLWGFATIEIAFGLAQGFGYAALRRNDRTARA